MYEQILFVQSKQFKKSPDQIIGGRKSSELVGIRR